MRYLTDNKIKLVITLIFLLRIFLLWLGYDRLPYFPTVGDEVIINDAAISLSRGEGFVAKSFKDDWLGLDKFYGHYPPVFLVFQSIIFRIFGISVFTLRFLNIFSHILSLFLLIYLFARLKFFKIIDNFAFFTISCLMLFEPVSLALARLARMDMLAVFFGVISLLILFSSSSLDKFSGWRWIISSVFIGLALSVHTESIIFWSVLVIMVIFNFRKFKWWFATLLIFLPGILFTAIWILTYRENSVFALMQMKKIASIAWGGFSLQYFLRMFFPRVPGGFFHNGGTALLLIFFSWLAISLRTLSDLRIWQRRLWDQARLWIYITMLYSISHLIILQFLSPQVGETRTCVVLPLALFTLGIAISHLSFRVRNLLIPLVFIFMLFELACVTFYFSRLYAEYADRDPNRFDSVVNSLPPAKKVAAESYLWFSFIKRNYPVRVLDDCVRPSGWRENDKYWLNNPETLNKFDIVILSLSNPLLRGKIIGKKYSKTFIAQKEKFVVLSDFMPISP